MTMAPLQHNISLLKIYLYFRSALASLLTAMFLVPGASNIVGTADPRLYFWTSVIYAGVCLLTLVFYSPSKLASSFNRLVGSLIFDILCVLTLLHASGGIESGLGYLVLIFVAISAIFIRGQLAIAFAAMTSLMVIAESIYLASTEGANNRFLFSAGTLGVLIFATAYAFQFLTEKLRQSNQEAAAQAAYAEHLQRLAQAIITRMRTGIIVIDQNQEVELINDSALQMMGLSKAEVGDRTQLGNISNLTPFIEKWRCAPEQGPVVEEIRPGLKARISLAAISLGVDQRIVVYLEDYRAVAQQAQQLKLASLGGLTASIAHEVRNPLGAISHAAQLLAESLQITSADKRLTEIIQSHSKRVNEIIESVLALSRRKEPQAQSLNLTTWVPHFLNQYTTGTDAKIDFKHQGDQHLVKMDPTHLSQVLTNLLDNGLRYSDKKTGEARVILRINQSHSDDTAYLEVIDFGDGIRDDQLPRIFDPFFTTDEKGSGLGLYISKELCEINQASLHYKRTADGASCFRIDFSHHQRMF